MLLRGRNHKHPAGIKQIIKCEYPYYTCTVKSADKELIGTMEIFSL